MLLKRNSGIKWKDILTSSRVMYCQGSTIPFLKCKPLYAMCRPVYVAGKTHFLCGRCVDKVKKLRGTVIYRVNRERNRKVRRVKIW